VTSRICYSAAGRPAYSAPGARIVVGVIDTCYLCGRYQRPATLSAVTINGNVGMSYPILCIFWDALIGTVNEAELARRAR
jgi:hypothetical protein